MRALCLILFSLVTGCSSSASKVEPIDNPPEETPVSDTDPAREGGAIERVPLELGAVLGGEFTPYGYVIGTDDTVSIQTSPGFPGNIVHRDVLGEVSAAEGLLSADAPLRFVRQDGQMLAESLSPSDGGDADAPLRFVAHERVTEAAPWREEAASTGCCAWWQHTLWRAAPGALEAGLLRAVTPPTRAWSVLDWHRPGAVEPVWRVLLTEGARGVVAARVTPDAKAVIAIVADAEGKSSALALATADGAELWRADLEGAAAEWRTGQGRLVVSADSARFAVLMENPSRCETCSRIDVFDAGNGERAHSVALSEIVAPRFSTLGLSGDVVWLFEHVTAKNSDMSTRPERYQYVAHTLGRDGSRDRTQTAPAWGLSSGATWALAPRFDAEGAVALTSPSSGGVEILRATEAP